MKKTIKLFFFIIFFPVFLVLKLIRIDKDIKGIKKLLVKIDVEQKNNNFDALISYLEIKNRIKNG